MSKAYLSVLIVSEVQFLGEGLAKALGRDGRILVACVCADVADALSKIRDVRPDIVLLDAALPDGSQSVGRVLSTMPEAKVVVFAEAETADDIIAWAEAGVAGYIPRTTALSDVVPLLLTIVQGEQDCSGYVAAGLLRRLCRTGGAGRDAREIRHCRRSPSARRRSSN